MNSYKKFIGVSLAIIAVACSAAVYGYVWVYLPQREARLQEAEKRMAVQHYNQEIERCRKSAHELYKREAEAYGEADAQRYALARTYEHDSFGGVWYLRNRNKCYYEVTYGIDTHKTTLLGGGVVVTELKDGYTGEAVIEHRTFLDGDLGTDTQGTFFEYEEKRDLLLKDL